MNRTQAGGPPVSCGAKPSDALRGEFSRQAVDNKGHNGAGPSCKKTILLVDDDLDLLLVRRLVFEFMGHSVLTAKSGLEALEQLNLNEVDAVVLDYAMPEMDGEETARRIRKIRPKLPIVLSTACLSVPQRVLDTVDASVNKGVQQGILFEVLEKQLALLPIVRGGHDVAKQTRNRLPA